MTSPSKPKQSLPSDQTGEVLSQIEIPAKDIRIGMYVVRLDRPWAEVPVLFREFVVQEESQLQVLRSHCQTVTVEVSEPQYHTLQGDASILPGKPLEAFPEHRSLDEELPVARTHYKKAHSYIDDLLHTVEGGQDISLEGFNDIVRDCVTSIMSNANAMFWLTRIRHEDAYTAEHCVRVGILAITFGRFLDLPEKDLQTLGMCGMLHDVGKMKIPNEILNKPAALSPEEWALMRDHPRLGYELLGSHHELDPIIRDSALSHHERIDGSGYPNGLAGQEIGLFARVVAIVDAYDAMTSDRPYMKGKPTVDALKILYKCSNSQFDGELVEVFIRMMGLYPPGSIVQLNSGEIAVVVSSKPEQKLKPVVELVLDREGHRCETRVLDLARKPLTDGGTPYLITRALPDGVPGFDLEAHIQARGGL